MINTRDMEIVLVEDLSSDLQLISNSQDIQPVLDNIPMTNEDRSRFTTENIGSLFVGLDVLNSEYSEVWAVRSIAPKLKELAFRLK